MLRLGQAVAVAPDERLLATGGADQTVRRGDEVELHRARWDEVEVVALDAGGAGGDRPARAVPHPEEDRPRSGGIEVNLAAVEAVQAGGTFNSSMRSTSRRVAPIQRNPLLGEPDLRMPVCWSASLCVIPPETYCLEVFAAERRLFAPGI